MTATMTSTKQATAPTEAEIREALTESIGTGYADLDDGGSTLLAPVLDSDMARVRIGWDPEFYGTADHRGTLWADMRPSEFVELERAMAEVVRRVEREATAALLEGAIAVAVRFAEDHPDVPRGAWPLPVTPRPPFAVVTSDEEAASA